MSIPRADPTTKTRRPSLAKPTVGPGWEAAERLDDGSRGLHATATVISSLREVSRSTGNWPWALIPVTGSLLNRCVARQPKGNIGEPQTGGRNSRWCPRQDLKDCQKPQRTSTFPLIAATGAFLVPSVPSASGNWLRDIRSTSRQTSTRPDARCSQCILVERPAAQLRNLGRLRWSHFHHA